MKKHTKKSSYFKVKRSLDFFFAIILFILTFPISIIIGILIKLEDGGPIIFSQTRTGKKGKNFNLYKFRSCIKNNEKGHNEDKYTKIGKIIRSSSLDELPQLINIIKGDMSFIGPRPWVPEYYHSMNKKQKYRYEVSPGITGLAQINGRNNLTIFEKINYDLRYIESISFLNDIKIAFSTIFSVSKGHGIDAGKNYINQELKVLQKNNHIQDKFLF